MCVQISIPRKEMVASVDGEEPSAFGKRVTIMRVLKFAWKCLCLLSYFGDKKPCRHSTEIDSHRWESKMEAIRHVSNRYS